MSGHSQGPPSSVLIVKLGAIGDVVMAIPAARALYDRGFAVEWVCSKVVAPLLDCYPWITTIVADDRAILKGSLVERAVALARLWRVIASKKYDLCATLYYDARYRVITLPVRAERRVMLSREDRSSRLIAARHHTEEYARILLGEEDTCRSESREPLRPERVPECTLPARRSSVRIGLVPGGASNMLRQQTLRRWPVAGYVAVARALLERGYEVVLLGGPDDAWVRPEFASLAADRDGAWAEGQSSKGLLDAIGKFGLGEVISACDTCDVVIAHDTGPLHLAALSTASLLGLYGPTDPGNFMPRRRGVRGIWGGEGFACRPCYDGRDFAPCLDNGCMQQITAEMVLRQLDELLEERRLGVAASPLIVLPSSLRRESGGLEQRGDQ